MDVEVEEAVEVEPADVDDEGVDEVEEGEEEIEVDVEDEVAEDLVDALPEPEDRNT